MPFVLRVCFVASYKMLIEEIKVVMCLAVLVCLCVFVRCLVKGGRVLGAWCLVLGAWC